MPQRKRSTATYLRRIGAKKLRSKFTEMVSGETESPLTKVRITGTSLSITYFGRLFIASFPHRLVGRNKSVSLQVSKSRNESKFAIALIKKSMNGVSLDFQAKLGFGFDTVFIEAIQGPPKRIIANPEFEAYSLNKELGMPWPNFLLKKIERHAKRLGFKRVFIHDPRTSSYLDFMVHLPNLSERGIEKKIMGRVQKLRKLVSNRKNPMLSRDEIVYLSKNAVSEFVDLRGRLLWQKALALNTNAFESTFFNLFYTGLQHEKEKKRIINFISWVAKNNEYKKTSDGYVKEF